MTTYREFVKLNFHKLPKSLSAKEKIQKIAQLWQAEKGKTHKRVASKGAGLGSTIGSVADEIFGLGLEKPTKVKRGAGRPRKTTKGAGLGSTIGSVADEIFGLGLEKPTKVKRGAGRPRKTGGVLDTPQVDGSGLEPLAKMLGLGLTKKHQKHRENLHKMLEFAYETGKKHHKVKGGSFLGSLLAGVAEPFRIASAIDPALGFGVNKVADAIGVPRVMDVIKG